MTRLFARIGLVVSLCLLWLGQPAGALAQDPLSGDVPVILSADEVTYDQNLDIITASGNVEIAESDRVLLADTVSYNINTKVVTASGNVSLLEPGGEVFFAQYVELTDDLREGFIRDVRLLLTDRSRMAAASAVRVDGNKTQLRRGIFSPCELCEDNPERAPLWQIKARTVTHDQTEKTVKYRDASFEVAGVPIMYTPYFEHPDPTVKRKTGFLAPTVGSSGNLGFTAQLPYYWAISPDKDLTFEPIITTKQGVVLAGEYRQILRKGKMELAGSGTIADRKESSGRTKSNQLRGHIDSEGRFDINETWRWGFDAERSTDDTYLRLYKISSKRSLTSRFYTEGFRGRNYIVANSYFYQGLRETDNIDETPLLIPEMDYNFQGEPGIVGGKYTLDVNVRGLHRIEGRQSRSVSVAGGWELPYTSPLGDVYRLRASVRGDGYWIDNFDPDRQLVINPENKQSFITGRVFPQLSLQWRYPWVGIMETSRQVVEPIVQAIAAPSGGMNPGEIPNEDSQDLEFDDTNLLSLNRFTGRDRIDPGTRIDYGLKWNLITARGAVSTAFIGQSYRLSKDINFQPGSGLEDNFSDVVGRVTLAPFDFFETEYRFRFDKDDLDTRRNELDVSIGPPALNVQLGYLDIDLGPDDAPFAGREELNVRLKSKLSEYWSAFVAHRRDLVADDSLTTQGGITYSDECIQIEAVAQRNFFEDRDIDSEDTFFVRVVLKHLGEFGTS